MSSRERDDPPIKLIELEMELRALMTGEFSSLTLSFNDLHAPSYMSLADAADDYSDWVSDEERTLAINRNSAWMLQWYPESPVGFNRLCASSLLALFDGLRRRTKDEQ